MNLSSQLRLYCTWNPPALVDGHPWPLPPPRWEKWYRAAASIVTTTTMRDRAKNRKPTQRGRYLSIEAIQAVQALKRSGSVLGDPLERVLAGKVRRLIKGDMVAVLLELQSQREGLLALKVLLPHLFVYSISTYEFVRVGSGVGNNLGLGIREQCRKALLTTQ